MKINKKLLTFISLSICLFIIVTGFSVFANSTNESKTTATGYNYPVKPGTTEWNNLNGRVERGNACQIPENVLKSLTTDELIETILNYPFLMDIYAYDTYQKGFKAVSERFNGLKELLQRKDSAIRLLSKYKNMEVAKDVSKVTSRQIFDLSNIEVILRQNEILTQLNDAEKNDLEKEVENKYIQKKEHKDIYGITAATSYKVQAEIQDSFVNAQTTIYVYTPKGTAVEVFQRGELLTASEKTSMDSYVENTYPTANVERTATTNYNCHSYAWYSTSSSNTYWMNDPSAYMTDGSYTKRTGNITVNSIGDRIYYSTSGNEHSGKVYAETMGNCPYMRSKWGEYGLITSYYTDCPYYVSDSAIKFYY